MDNYVEIKLLPDTEFAPTMLMSALVNKLHRGLADLNSRAIGISFPDVEIAQKGLGDRLRIHGRQDWLRQLMGMNWLMGMRDHTSVGEIDLIPQDSQYRVVRRVQSKSSPERLQRRLAKRKMISIEEARNLIGSHQVKYLDLPFVTVRSQSTGQTFPLFIEHKLIQTESTPGDFSHYGLSATATVPWF